MCNCISELSAPSLYKNSKGKVIEHVNLPTALMWDKEKNRLRAVTVSIAQLIIQGKKSTEKFTLEHTYCPFCGHKYEDDTEVEATGVATAEQPT